MCHPGFSPFLIQLSFLLFLSLLDFSREEERAAHSNITVVVAAETGDLLFVNGTGSQVLLSPQVLKECIQITKLREQLVKDTIDLAVQPQ